MCQTGGTGDKVVGTRRGVKRRDGCLPKSVNNSGKGGGSNSYRFRGNQKNISSIQKRIAGGSQQSTEPKKLMDDKEKEERGGGKREVGDVDAW